jgi:hypothetical protein
MKTSNQIVRLRRLVCGKALPFRSALQIFSEALRHIGSMRRSLEALKNELDGKAKPFRTSGGKAATVNSMSCAL